MVRRRPAFFTVWPPLLLGGALLLAGLAAAGSQSEPAGGIPPAETPDATPQALPGEDDLLRHACRYLLLSRRQLAQLVPVAKRTDEALALLVREEAPRLRELEKLGDTPEAAVLRKALESRRAQVESQVVKFASEQLARLWTREQIALAERLADGTPPEYAHAHPALLDPKAGFAYPSARSQLGGLSAHSPGSPVTRRLREDTLLLDSISRQIQGGGLPGGSLRRDRATGRRGPFAQLVVETNQLSDLMFGVESLARRLFLSERWLPFLQSAAARGLGEGAGVSYRMATMGSLRLLREYRMERGFRDLTGKGPELEPLGGTLDHGAYFFGPGQGLRLSNTGVTDHYDLEFSFRTFTDNGNYQKLLDFKNGTRDAGLYLFQGHLTFYTLADGGAPQAGQEHRLRLERNRYTRIVRGYLDFRPIFAFIDLDGEAVFEKSSGTLFKDDTTTSGEQGPGALKWVSVRGPSRS